MLGFCPIFGLTRSLETAKVSTTRGRRFRATESGLVWPFTGVGVRCGLVRSGLRLSGPYGGPTLSMSSDARKPAKRGTSDGDERKGKQLSDLDKVEIVQVRDLNERAAEALPCFVEDAVRVDGTEYLVMTPCLQPVIFARFEEGDEESALVPIDDPAEIDRLFKDAFLALAEQDLCLVRTAVVMTVDGDLSEFFDEDNDDAVEEEDVEDELLGETLDELDATAIARASHLIEQNSTVDPLESVDEELALAEGGDEEVEVLVTFEDAEGRIYYICAPMEPLFLIGRRSDTEPSRVTVADRDEQDRVGPLIERQVQERLDRAANASGHILG